MTPNQSSERSTPSAPARDQPRVLVLEDEPDLREAIVSYLGTESMQVHGVGSLAEASAWCEAQDFDILILDLGLPDGDGVRWLQESLPPGQKGVLMLTARGLPAQRVTGLRAGADAYLVKPVALEELALHVGKLFARIRASAARPAASSARPGWQLHATTWMLTAPNGRSLLLKHAEKLLLQALIEPAGEVVSKELIIQSQGGRTDSYDYRRIETLIRRLRIRCRESLGTELPVQTIYGRGLAFTEPGRVTHHQATRLDTPPG